jgi:hypothetical protein
MKELGEDIGRIYKENDYFYLEKVFSSLDEVIMEEPSIKVRSKKNGFKIIESSWSIQKNPHYVIEYIMNDGDVPNGSEVRFIYTMKLEYIK